MEREDNIDSLHLPDLVEAYQFPSNLYTSLTNINLQGSNCVCDDRCDILIVDDNIFNVVTLQTILD